MLALWTSDPRHMKGSLKISTFIRRPWTCFTHTMHGDAIYRVKYELRPAVKKLYQLRPKVSASRVSVASRVVNPKHDELRPAFSKDVHQSHRKIGVYKMSNNWKVLTRF